MVIILLAYLGIFPFDHTDILFSLRLYIFIFYSGLYFTFNHFFYVNMQILWYYWQKWIFFPHWIVLVFLLLLQITLLYTYRPIYGFPILFHWYMSTLLPILLGFLMHHGKLCLYVRHLLKFCFLSISPSTASLFCFLPCPQGWKLSCISSHLGRALSFLEFNLFVCLWIFSTMVDFKTTTTMIT